MTIQRVLFTMALILAVAAQPALARQSEETTPPPLEPLQPYPEPPRIENPFPEDPAGEGAGEGSDNPAPLAPAIPPPQTLSYQGFLQNGGTPVNGTANFVFRLYHTATAGAVVWSETQNGITVSDGAYTAILGSSTPLDADLFKQALFLEVAVNGNVLSPRTPLTRSGSAFVAQKLDLPFIDTGSERDGLVRLRNEYSPGLFELPRTMRLEYAPGGTLSNYVDLNTSLYGVWAAHNNGNTAGVGGFAASLYGVSQYSSGYAVYGQAHDGAQAGYFLNSTNNTVPALYVQTQGGEAAHFRGGDAEFIDDSGNPEIIVRSNGLGSGGQLLLYRQGVNTVDIVASESGTQGSQITLKDGSGAATIQIDGDFEGDGRVTTEELEITGGADLAELFDVRAEPAHLTPQPGHVVSIDPARPGRLRLSTDAYDPTVAGVISGAGGIEPGLLMGQDGSEADGDTPVALTGRVYVWADASTAPIEPGNLLTTAARPGHAMKATDHEKAHGAIIGKAMTGLESGTGLVLMLVTLH